MKHLLQRKQVKLRKDFIKLLVDGKKFHIGGTLSCLDLMVCIFYKFINLKSTQRDYFILSKGHALASLYLIMLDQNIISRKNLFKKYLSCDLGGQLDIFAFSKYVDWNTGSLGHSIGVATGLAIANPKKKIWTLVGDAEIDEGSVWEALFFISEKKIKNINIIIDRNKISASSRSEKKEIFDKNFFEKFDLNIKFINGHKLKEITKTFLQTKNTKKSNIIVADTIKGKGFKEFENSLKYSHELPDLETLKKIYNRE